MNHLGLNVNPFLSGTLPTQLGSLAALQSFWLNSDPLLSGLLPAQLTALTQITSFIPNPCPKLCGTQLSIGTVGGTTYDTTGASPLAVLTPPR